MQDIHHYFLSLCAATLCFALLTLAGCGGSDAPASQAHVLSQAQACLSQTAHPFTTVRSVTCIHSDRTSAVCLARR